MKIPDAKEVIKETQKKSNKLHFTSLMNSYHIKNSELEPQLSKYRRKDELQGDIVKDDSGVCAVFTESDLSVTQMKIAGVLDNIVRLWAIWQKVLMDIFLRTRMFKKSLIWVK